MTVGVHYPANLDTDFFPGARVVVGELVLDDLPAQPGEFYQRYRERLTALIANPISQDDHWWARSYAVQAGWQAFRDGSYEIALRFWVNRLRLCTTEGLDWTIRKNFALYLQELGDYENAAANYLVAAEGAERDGRGLEAADLFERVALAWEAQSHVHGVHCERPALGTDMGSHNSTTCFRKAKYLYANAGDAESTSRCSVLERETDRKWSANRDRRFLLNISRFLWLHGESYLYVARAIAVTVIAFTFGFYFAGYRVDGVLAQSASLSESLYLSVITLATVGYGDLTPRAGFSRFLAGTEGFLGIVLMAMLLVTIQRRFVGR